MRVASLLLLVILFVSACNDAVTSQSDGSSAVTVGAADGDMSADASPSGDVLIDAADASDASDAEDVSDAGDSALRWDILLPDVPSTIDAGVTDRVVPQDDVATPTPDRPSPDVVAPWPDVVIPLDRPDVVIPLDRPDVVIPLDRPDVVIPPDRPDVAIPLDRPDVVIPLDRPDVVIPLDRPDVVTFDQPDVVTIDRPDVVTFDQPDVVTIDRPDVVTIDRPDVVTVDRPDVVTVDRPDVVTVDRPDVVTVDRPDVVTVTDVGGTPGPDPVIYRGTFPVRTGSFSSTLTVQGNGRSVRLHVPANAGSNPPLLFIFHGTNGDGAQVMSEANAVALANTEGVIVAAPSSRWLGVGDFDHATEETYWETQRNTDPDSNEDVLLVRAIMVEAQRVYGVDPTRIYAMGHSNGAFFAGFIATLLGDRIAAFSENSGGLVTCARTTSCRFQGSGTSCAVLATRAGWCNCAGPELPMPLSSTGRRVPGYITHGTSDPLVSVYYSCTLQARMTALNMPVQITLFNGEGHAIPTNWAQLVWPFFRAIRLTP